MEEPGLIGRMKLLPELALPGLEEAEQRAVEQARAMTAARNRLDERAAAVGALRTDLEIRASSLDERRTYLAGRPKDQHGKHEYSFADLRLDPAVERERFARYQRHFSVPEESIT